MATTVKMFAPAGVGGTIQTANSGNVFVQSDGTVTVSPLDVADLMKLGFQFALTEHRMYSTPGAPAAASAAAVVSSVGFSAGTLSIAAQPDVPRQLAVVVNAGAASLTAGLLTMTYTANDGTTQTDTLSFGGIASSGTQTLTTSKGVEKLSSAVVSGVSGGSSPGVQVGTNGVLALPVCAGFVDFAVTKEIKIAAGAAGATDETIGTVTASGGLVAPSTAPNGTLQYSFGYTFLW